MNFCTAILILKMEENVQHFWLIMLYYFKKDKTQLKCKKRFVQCMKNVLWLIEYGQRGLPSFLVLLTFWPNNSLLWGCITHWKMFSSTPGLYPLEANSEKQPTYSKYPNQWNYHWKWKMPFILQKKCNKLFGRLNIFFQSTWA